MRLTAARPREENVNNCGSFLRTQLSLPMLAGRFFPSRGGAKCFNQNMGDIVIVTFWQSFDQLEKSHAGKLFKEKFSALANFCEDTYEVGYEMLWQEVPED